MKREEVEQHLRGYVNSRKRVAKCETAGTFARRLAQEFTENRGDNDYEEGEKTGTLGVPVTAAAVMEPKFERDVIREYNKPRNREVRLRNEMSHER